jgi:hypothetical protein
MHFRRRKNAHFSELIGEIYGAGRDPSPWSEVVGGAGRFVGGSTAAIFSRDPVAGSGNVYHETAIDPYYRELHCDEYAKRALSTTGGRRAEAGHLITVADLLPCREFLGLTAGRGEEVQRARQDGDDERACDQGSGGGGRTLSDVTGVMPARQAAAPREDRTRAGAVSRSRRRRVASAFPQE